MKKQIHKKKWLLFVAAFFIVTSSLFAQKSNSNERLIPNPVTLQQKISEHSKTFGNSTVKSDVKGEAKAPLFFTDFNDYSLRQWTKGGAGQSLWVNWGALYFYPQTITFSDTSSYIMIKEPVNTEGQSKLLLIYDGAVFGKSSSKETYLKIKTTADGGNTWHEVKSWQLNTAASLYGKFKITIDNEDVGSPTFQFGFFIEGATEAVNNCRFDNLGLYKYYYKEVEVSPLEIFPEVVVGTERPLIVNCFNNGIDTASSSIKIKIVKKIDNSVVYSETKKDTIFPLIGKTVTMPSWQGFNVGEYSIYTSISIDGDEDISNNQVTSTITAFDVNNRAYAYNLYYNEQYKKGPVIIDLDSQKVIPYDFGEYESNPYGGDFNIDGNLYNIIYQKGIFKIDTITGGVEKITDFNLWTQGIAFSAKHGCLFISTQKELYKMNIKTSELELIDNYNKTTSMKSIALNKDGELYGTDGKCLYKIDINTAKLQTIGGFDYNMSSINLAFDKEKENLLFVGNYYDKELSKNIYVIGGIDTDDAEIHITKELPPILLQSFSIKSKNTIATGSLTGVIKNSANDTINGKVWIFNNSGFLTDAISNTANGYAFDNIPEGDYKLVAQSQYYNNSDTTNVTISNSTPAVKDFTLTDASNKVTFVVVKYIHTEDSLKNCHILFYGADSLTGPTGTITFEKIPNGTYNFKITKTGYLDYTGTVTVSGTDVKIDVKLIIDKLIARKLPLMEMAIDMNNLDAPGAENGLTLMNSVNAYSTELALLSYHKSDNYSISDAESRINYYGNVEIPTAIFNGIEFIQGGGDSLFNMYYNYNTAYYTAGTQKTPVKFSIFQKDFDEAANTVTVGIALDAKGVVTTPENAVHIALTQSRIKEEWNGMNEVNNVVRELYNGAEGVTVDIDSLTKKDTVYATFTLKEEWGGRPKYFNIVAFVQGKNTKNGDDSKYVYNADMVEVESEKYYTVNFIGVDEISHDTIDIKTKLNNKFKLTNLSIGAYQAVFTNIEDEDWVYDVQSFGYFDFSDTLKLRSDTTIVVNMKKTDIEYIWHEDCDRMTNYQVPDGWKFVRPTNDWNIYVINDWNKGGKQIYNSPYQYDTLIIYTPKIKIAECGSLFYTAYGSSSTVPNIIVGYTTDTSDINAVVGLDTLLLSKKDSVFRVDLRNIFTVDSVHFVFKYDYNDTAFGTFYIDDFAITKLSHNPHLSNIILSAGTMNPVFNRDTLNYTVILPVGTTDVPTVTPVTEYESASYEVTDATAIPGTTTIKVTAEDQSTELTYSLYFSSANAYLSSITLSDGSSLTPVFDKETYTYTVVMPSSSSAIPTVSATADDESAVVEITNATEIPGTATIKVTAEDGITVLNYYVNFTSNNTYLSGITLSDGSLSPDFDKETYTYTVVLSSSTADIPTASAVTEDSKATIVITDATNMAEATTIVVTAVDGTTQATYTINFTSDNAFLSSITLSEGTLNPEFDKETLTYTVDVPMGTTDAPDVTAVTEDQNATVNITAATEVPGTTTIVVTAIDGSTQKTYSIDFVLGINYAQFSNVKLYPNPTKNVLNIINTNNVKSINILSLDGRMVLINNEINSNIKIELNDLLSGTYIVKILFNDGSVLNKTIIKQ